MGRNRRRRRHPRSPLMEGSSGVRKGKWSFWSRMPDGTESTGGNIDGEEDWLEGKGPTYMEWSEEKQEFIARPYLTGAVSVHATFFLESGGPPVRYQRTASSAAPPLASQENPCEVRDWSQLPADVLLVIFKKLGVFDVLKGAEHVCRKWWTEAKDDPAVWRCVDMYNAPGNIRHEFDLLELARTAVDRIDGKLESFLAEMSCDDTLLKYIAERITP